EGEEVAGEEVEADGGRQREPQRADLTALDRGGERTGAQCALVALLEQRQHALPELGQLRLRPLAPEKVPAQLTFELLDGAGERRLGNVALLGRLGEIQLTDRGKEISALVHFHSGDLSTC